SLLARVGWLLRNWNGQRERRRQERPSDILPDHVRLDEEALWFDKLTERRDGESDVQPQRIGSPLRVTAITCDSHDGSYGRLLDWHPTPGQFPRRPMPLASPTGHGQRPRPTPRVNSHPMPTNRPPPP
ncbi:DUF927 domain-containing protein, partial [Salmonella enterica]|uniref:DUF927 domain-containing protein n=1 Tax=Salmonella enterica TaxID=28901 RepID=UPI00398C5375